VEVLAEGDARIFGRRRAREDDGWLLVVFSVPESQRERRHRLRSELSHLGFGTVAPGVWIAPGHLGDEVREVLRRCGLADYVELFSRARVPDARAAVARWWDLDALHERYAGFLGRHAPARHRAHPDRALDPAEAFADHVRLVTDWRGLPYADPGLPLELLPADWNGARAADLFAELANRLSGPAREHAHRLLDA
jgi:phenylacetic acid degradation operon negative regulatory protein